MYDVYEQPSELTIGQLSESWEHIAEMLREETPSLGYGLAWLADVLRAIGQDTIG